MFGGIDPKKIQGMMSKMGIKNQEIEAKRVIIEQDSGKIIIDNPQVTKITMQGQESFQVVGDIREETGISEEDIHQVMKQTGVSKAKAEQALKDSNGDLAEAILSLS